MGYLHKPQQLWWRKVLFQVHLWVGIILGIYMIVVALTGSILVFKDELAMLSYPKLMHAARANESARAELPTVIERARVAYPQHKLVSAYAPGVFGETFLIYMEAPRENWLYVFADPADGHVIGALDLKSSWLFWAADLHFRLLAGEVGFILNGIGAGFLALLCVTGTALWWPGIRKWAWALKVNFRRSWKRINFDLHSAVGFWTLAIIFMWALSGMYFVWPKQFEAVIGKFSSVASATEPAFDLPPPATGRSADLRRVAALAQAASPASRMSGIYLPEDPKIPITVFMARKNIGDFSQMDHVYFDPSSGTQLAVWHAGVNPTLGGKLLYWLGPLHFGVYWGLPVKIIWATLGLSLPLLTVTGALMYWNRALGRLWRQLKAGRRKRVSPRRLPQEVEEPSFTDI